MKRPSPSFGPDTPWRKPPESLVVPIAIGGVTFPFHLFTRPLQLGDKQIQYYWMDVSGLRSLDSPVAEENFRSCVGHWWQAMHVDHIPDEYDKLQFVTAMCYGVCCRDKSMQTIYRDAVLDSLALYHLDLTLPQETSSRIKAIVQSRDRERVREELDRVMNRLEPSEDLMPQLQRDFEKLIGDGVQALEIDGQEGLARFLEKHLDPWMRRCRKRGGLGELRTFMNMLAYETKAAFYLCYANSWIDLIPRLKTNRGLDPLSERFLRVWHHQNQPMALPNGSFLPDVFSGQVLALHPLSGIFMKDPALCAIAGRFLASDDYQAVDQRQSIESASDYWDFVGAILCAAHQYRLADQRIAERRKGGRKSTNAYFEQPATKEASPAESPDSLRFEEYAQHLKLDCPQCHGSLQYVRFHPANAAARMFAVDYRCSLCAQPLSKRFSRRRFETWL